MAPAAELAVNARTYFVPFACRGTVADHAEPLGIFERPSGDQADEYPLETDPVRSFCGNTPADGSRDGARTGLRWLASRYRALRVRTRPGNWSSMCVQARSKWRSRYALLTLNPYPARDADGLTLCHPLARLVKMAPPWSVISSSEHEVRCGRARVNIRCAAACVAKSARVHVRAGLLVRPSGSERRAEAGRAPPMILSMSARLRRTARSKRYAR